MMMASFPTLTVLRSCDANVAGSGRDGTEADQTHDEQVGGDVADAVNEDTGKPSSSCPKTSRSSQKQVLIVIAPGSCELEVMTYWKLLRHFEDLVVVVASDANQCDAQDGSSQPMEYDDIAGLASHHQGDHGSTNGHENAPGLQGPNATVRMESGSNLRIDMTLQHAINYDWDLIILPGGYGGCQLMHRSETLSDLLRRQAALGKMYAASGFAPICVLQPLGLLPRVFTCFPSRAVLKKLLHQSANDKTKSTFRDDDVVLYDNVATCQGLGTVMRFAIELGQWVKKAPLQAADLSQQFLIDRTGMRGYPRSYCVSKCRATCDGVQPILDKARWTGRVRIKREEDNDTTMTVPSRPRSAMTTQKESLRDADGNAASGLGGTARACTGAGGRGRRSSKAKAGTIRGIHRTIETTHSNSKSRETVEEHGCADGNESANAQSVSVPRPHITEVQIATLRTTADITERFIYDRSQAGDISSHAADPSVHSVAVDDHKCQEAAWSLMNSPKIRASQFRVLEALLLMGWTKHQHKVTGQFMFCTPDRAFFFQDVHSLMTFLFQNEKWRTHFRIAVELENYRALQSKVTARQQAQKERLQKANERLQQKQKQAQEQQDLQARETKSSPNRKSPRARKKQKLP